MLELWFWTWGDQQKKERGFLFREEVGLKREMYRTLFDDAEIGLFGGYDALQVLQITAYFGDFLRVKFLRRGGRLQLSLNV